jgi:predicted amidophosphoribosyltransferase
MRSFLRTLSSILFDEDFNFEIHTDPFKSNRFGIPIFAGSRLSPDLSHIALRAKEDNDLHARKFLAKLIFDAMKLTNYREFDLVPIPSRYEADRIRGIKHIHELVKEVNKLYPVNSHALLKHVRKVKDQATLTHLERLENLQGAFAIRDGQPTPAKVFLVDDLVTSGATIKAAADALKARNIELLGVVAACATMVFTE